MKKEEKTNVMRLLDQKKVAYQPYQHDLDASVSGEEVAKAMGQNPNQTFKTLVTIGHSKVHYVFVIPVNKELDLKKAAKVVGEKKVEMVKSKELLPLTGYVHGGCSPIGMKKFFQTTIDQTAEEFDTIFFSAGRVGRQVEVGREDLKDELFSNRALIVLFVPLIIEQFLNILVGLLDSLMIAHVGEAAVSGVSLVDSCFNLLNMLFFAAATGGAVVAGQYIGKKDEENACKATNQIVWFMLFLSLIVMVLVYLGQNLILHGIFGQIQKDVENYARTYLLIVSASIPFLALYSAGAALFRSMGDSKTPMKISLLMNFINFGGNAVCIFAFKMGTEGVALPTLCARIISAVIILSLLKNPALQVHLPRKLTFQWERKMIKSILIVALPNGIENSMFHIGKITVLSLVSSFGTYAIAANALSNTVASFQTLVGSAAQLAIVAVVSQCLGANQQEQAKYYTIKIHKMTYLGMLIMNVVIWLLLPAITNWYGLSPQATHAAIQILILHGISSIVVWPTSFVMPCIFRASGDGRYSMTVAILTMFLVRVFMSYVLASWMGLGVLGVWIATALDELARSILYVARFKSSKWLSKRVIS